MAEQLDLWGVHAVVEAARALPEPIDHMDCLWCLLEWPQGKWDEREHEWKCPWRLLQEALATLALRATVE